MEQKRCNCSYLRRNRPRRFHALVEIRRDRRTPVVRLWVEPPRDPNQSDASPVIDYKQLSPGEAKETHPMTCVSSHRCLESLVVRKKEFQLKIFNSLEVRNLSRQNKKYRFYLFDKSWDFSVKHVIYKYNF